MYEKVLACFEGFLRERALVRSGLEDHYVRWAGDFLAFAAEDRRSGRDGAFEETLARFLQRLGERPDRPGWQIGQAKNAVRMYYYQFRGGGGERGDIPATGTALSCEAATARAKELLRVRHYSYRTEQTYLSWIWRFYDYVASQRSSDEPDGGVAPRGVRDYMAHLALKERVSAHTMRHSFATHLLMQGVNVRQVQEYMGHAKLETTMIYLHVVRELSPKADSPLDRL